jgi:uncharacterized membrane protein
MTGKKDTNPERSQVPRCVLMSILAGLMLLTMIYSVSAATAIPAPTTGDTAAFNQILQPVWKVYNLVKYIASAIAAVFLLFAGVKYMTSGNDMMQRENAKHMVTYVVVGLIVTWAAPFVVQLFTA